MPHYWVLLDPVLGPLCTDPNIFQIMLADPRFFPKACSILMCPSLMFEDLFVSQQPFPNVIPVTWGRPWANWEIGRQELRQWTLEVFRTTTNDLPVKGYRSDMSVSIPFHHRITSATAVGYNLLSLASCAVLPWNNRLRQLTTVLFRFMPVVSFTMSGERPPALKITPPQPFIFKRRCQALAPVPVNTPGEALGVASHGSFFSDYSVFFCV